MSRKDFSFLLFYSTLNIKKDRILASIKKIFFVIKALYFIRYREWKTMIIDYPCFLLIAFKLKIISFVRRRDIGNGFVKKEFNSQVRPLFMLYIS